MRIFSRAPAPEAAIAAAVAVAPHRPRSVALGVVGFAVLGVLAGLGFVLASDRPRIAADLAYHRTMTWTG